MRNACPISNETVDERTARLGALVGLALLGLSLTFASPWPVLLLAADYGLRGFGARSFSPVSSFAQWLRERLGIAPKTVNAGPKAFAAKLGFGFSLTVATALLLGHDAVALAAGLPFAACALLEGAAGFCVGCHMYQTWHRLFARTEAASQEP
jgi:hypothetical protein